ncbi:MAG: DUF1499 domain-containing protein [Pseudomonadales bacterium]
MSKTSKLQIIAIVVAVVAMLGLKLGVLPFGIAFPGFALALLVVVLIGVFGLLALLWGLVRSNSDSRGAAMQMMLIGIVPLAVIALMVGPGLSAPPIHDITTDITDPPQFVAGKAAREEGENSTDYEGEVIAKQQREAFPDLKSIKTSLGQQAAFDRSLEVVNEMGWTVLEKDVVNGRIEAYEETALFGFIDDVVIRVRGSEENGSVIDLRSNSRVGQGDLGANAKRIRGFVEAF